MPYFRNPFKTLQELSTYTHGYTKIPQDPRTSPAIRLLASTNNLLSTSKTSDAGKEQQSKSSFLEPH